MELDWVTHSDPPAQETDARRPLVVEIVPGELLTEVQVAEERARRDIVRYRLAIESRPNSAEGYNRLAWVYATAPEKLRDIRQAVALAEKAASLDPSDPVIRNTLGVAYYRADRYREAAETLTGNLSSQSERELAGDLYFLAMSHHRLGDVALAEAYYTWANRATVSQDDLTDREVKERAAFRAEAAILLGK